jgi:hypothetical protein
LEDEMNFSRRQFMKAGGGLAAGVILDTKMSSAQKLVDLIVKQTMRDAMAGGQALSAKYINISMPGAPPRWQFDQFLQLKSTESVAFNPMVATTYSASNGTYQNSKYQTFNYKGTMVPSLWGTNAFNASGGARPMSTLLDNIIVFRGYGTGVDGHPTNGIRQTNPVPGAGSISGHMADSSSTLFKALQFPNLGSESGYSSTLGTALTALSYQGKVDYISLLLNPFGTRSETTNINQLRSRYADLVTGAQTTLSALATTDHADFPAVALDQQQALLKIKNGIADLEQAWGPLFTKYAQIVRNNFLDRSTAGLNDKPVLTGQDDGSSGESVWSYFDGTTYFPEANQDVRDWVTNFDYVPIASAFALGEFVVARGLTSAYELQILQPGGISFSSVRTAGSHSHSPSIRNTNLTFDQHVTGIGVGLYLNSCLYRMLAGCLLELTDQLKAAGVYNNTVIHLTQDFGRSPKSSGGGQDHGYDSMIASVFTGMQTAGPLVLGNILASGSNGELPSANYPGCFGFKAPTNVSGTIVSLTPAHVASSIAVLLGLPDNPWKNTSAPLLSLNNGVPTSQAESKMIS